MGLKIAAASNICSKFTIIHSCIDVFLIKEFQDIPGSVFKRNQTKQDLQRRPIYLTDSCPDYIIDKIGQRETIDNERNIRVESE